MQYGQQCSYQIEVETLDREAAHDETIYQPQLPEEKPLKVNHLTFEQLLE